MRRTRSADRLAGLTGPVWWSGDPEVESHLATWNARVKSGARGVAQPTCVKDVQRAVRAVAESGWDLAVRGGGHHVSGSGVMTDGLVLDMRRLRSVVPIGGRTLRVGAGANWEAVALAARGLGGAVPAGNTPSTGVVGVALGGGIGLFSRAWGLTCDRLRAVGLVDAEGVHRRIDARCAPDLFRLARGAGRGIGVVTDLDLEICPCRPEVATVQVHHPMSALGEVLRAWLDAASAAPREVGTQLTVQHLPDVPHLDPRLRDRWLVSVGAVHAADPSTGQPALTPFAQLGPVLVDDSGVVPALERARPWRAGIRVHSCSHFLPGLDDAAVRSMVALFDDCPEGATLTLRCLGGAVAEVSPFESTFAHRDARLLATAQVEWRDSAEDDAAEAWSRHADAALADAGTSGVYGNFVGSVEEFAHLRPQAYGDVSAIDAILRAHDPYGMFASMAARP